MIKIILRIVFGIKGTSSRPANCLPDKCFCEGIRKNSICQPVDAYSNIAFVLSGVFMLFYLLKSKNINGRLFNSNLSRKTLYIYALAQVAVGFGSYLYHAKFNFLGQWLDDDSMYLIGVFLFLYSLSHFKNIRIRYFLATYILVNLFLETLIFFIPSIRGDLFAILIVGFTICELIANRRKGFGERFKYFYISLGLFFIAYVIWVLDYLKIVCHPYSLIQGHAVWHVLTSIASIILFFYMDTKFSGKVKVAKS